MSTGYIIYRGPSALDGSPIVAIVTAIKGSKNIKTGNMVQTYILRDDMSPVEASRTGADAAICGTCRHRGTADGTKAIARSCYVNLGQGPTSVYKALQRGNYPYVPAELVADMVEGRMVRLGTYGDPAAVPVGIWQSLIAHAAGWTGYTHQWWNLTATNHAAAYQSLVMASADTEQERREAVMLGWRTFRVRTATEALTKGEAACPASEEAGRKLTCNTCGACSGTARGRKGSIAIIAHGSGKGSFAKAQANI